MSSLGQLSAEVSHEVNTPLGISITSISYLADITAKLKQDVSANKISKRTIDTFTDNAQCSIELLSSNLQRAAELMTSFKQVAVDQMNDKIRVIHIAKYIDEIIHSIQPKLKKTQHKIMVNCDSDIEIYTHPGAIAQIIINLIINSITHGFENIKHGLINIEVSLAQKRLVIIYKDNGVGLDEEALKQIFTPFYTTQADKGGTGLGAHIIKNLVINTLNGSIDVHSQLGKGLHYRITLPDMRYS